MNDEAHSLITAARAVARAGLVDAFGHLSIRTSHATVLLTPPKPLSSLTNRDEPAVLQLGCTELPDSAPKEAWIHVALMERDAKIGAVCRAQPRAVAAIAAVGRVPRALNGHAAMLGPIAMHRDSRLIRDRSTAEMIACATDTSKALVLRGNGAVTWGSHLADAVASMWVLERSAELELRAATAGTPAPLPLDERSWWHDRADELLPRIYRYLQLATSDPLQPSFDVM